MYNGITPQKSDENGANHCGKSFKPAVKTRDFQLGPSLGWIEMTSFWHTLGRITPTESYDLTVWRRDVSTINPTIFAGQVWILRDW